ncbi:hypothetical protein [Aequorivita sp. CIP111184]|uniref:hypothetical protein n=1 Tax=Aequorivita sp. CIP111184 TaxID=2211356 RepID=UPI000DBBB9CE|nr:hypothetical protein [Aequorivita sp. CIP111184]SRX54588.1 hypothetical protein AEQU1_01599 [Aequorivita sp. CIP111184]
MFFQTAIIIIILSLIIGLLVWFFTGKRALVRIHNEEISMLETAISTNRFQINFRNSNLNTYDFLKFNLNEALIVQPETLL